METEGTLPTGLVLTSGELRVVIGRIARRSRLLGRVGIGVFGVIGAVAAVTRPAGSPLDALPSLAGAGAGVVALRLLLGLPALNQGQLSGATNLRSMLGI